MSDEKTIGGYVLLNADGNPLWQSFRAERRQVWEVFTLPWAQTENYEYAMECKKRWEAEGMHIAACRITLFPLPQTPSVAVAEGGEALCKCGHAIAEHSNEPGPVDAGYGPYCEISDCPCTWFADQPGAQLAGEGKR